MWRNYYKVGEVKGFTILRNSLGYFTYDTTARMKERYRQAIIKLCRNLDGMSLEEGRKFVKELNKRLNS